MSNNKNNNYCVYVHTSPNGKMYIGQTGKIKPEYRWGVNGIGYLRKKNNKYMQPAFANAILKYGWDNFEHEIVSSNLTKEEADTFEKLLIEKLNTTNRDYGYNCKEGGSHGSPSEETIKKMRESHLGEKSHMYGKHLSEETKNKIKESRKGFRHSEETKKKLSELNKGERNAFYGKRHSDESKRKMSNSRKGLLAGINHSQARKISQYDLQGNLIKTWDYMKEAGEELKINYHNIYSCCKGNRRTCGGFVWRYYEDEITNEYLLWCNEVSPDKYSKKCVAQYSLSGELIDIYESITDAELKTGVHGVSACCRGKRKTSGGFIWRYYKDDEYVA